MTLENAERSYTGTPVHRIARDKTGAAREVDATHADNKRNRRRADSDLVSRSRRRRNLP